MQALLMAHAPTAVIVLLAVVYLQAQIFRMSRDLRDGHMDLKKEISTLSECIAKVEAKLDIPRSA